MGRKRRIATLSAVVAFGGIVAGGSLAGQAVPQDSSGSIEFQDSSGSIELTASQLLINQRISQAAVRRVNALQAMIDGVAPAASGGGSQGGSVTLSVRQLQINQRISQAAVRRVNSLTALVEGRSEPSTGPGRTGRITLTAGQLRINQRIAQAAVRRVNALAARVPDLPVPRPPIDSPTLDRVLGEATGLRTMRITKVQRGSATRGAVVVLVLPPELRQASIFPGNRIVAVGVAAEGVFYGFYVSVEEPAS